MLHVIGRTLLIALSTAALTPTLAQDAAPAVSKANAAEVERSELIEIVPFADRMFTDRAALFVRHAAAFADPVDVYVGGQLVFRTLLQGTTATFPAAVPLGTHEVVVVRAGTLPDPQTSATEAAPATPTDTAAPDAVTTSAPTAPAAAMSNVLLRRQITVSAAAPFTLALGGTLSEGLEADLNSGDPQTAQGD